MFMRRVRDACEVTDESRARRLMSFVRGDCTARANLFFVHFDRHRIQLFDASRTKYSRVFDLFHKSLSSSLRYTPVWCGSRVLNFDGTAKVSPLLPHLAWVRTSDTSPGSPLRIVIPSLPLTTTISYKRPTHNCFSNTESPPQCLIRTLSTLPSYSSTILEPSRTLIATILTIVEIGRASCRERV